MSKKAKDKGRLPPFVPHQPIEVARPGQRCTQLIRMERALRAAKKCRESAGYAAHTNNKDKSRGRAPIPLPRAIWKSKPAKLSKTRIILSQAAGL
jgi:hypothetical protein